MKDNCLFCKIVRGEVESLKLYEDDDCIAILDAFPETNGHTLVIPKKHYEDIYEVPSEVLTKMFEIGKNKTNKIMNKLNKPSSSFLINYGDAQAIKHIHLHLIPDFMHPDKSLSREEVFEILKED